MSFVDRFQQQNKTPFDANDGISLTELAKKSGVTERTIRYYIARGIIAGPARGGRAAEYTQEHLAGIRDVRRMQSMGLTLAEIEHRIKQPADDLTAVEAESWWVYRISPDVTVQVRSGLGPWRVRHVRSAIARLAAELTFNKDQQENGGD
jgi:DNA-binding transcriptional MerR regulator